MTQSEIDRLVAAATGEDLCEIQHRGFSLADPMETHFDPEPVYRAPHTLDWDEIYRVEPVRRFHRRSRAPLAG